MKFLLGYKKGMTQVFVDDKAIPVTIVQVPENTVCNVNKENDKTYVVVGVGQKKNPSNAEAGQFKAAKVVPAQMATFRIEGDIDLKVGDKLDMSDLKPGSVAYVTGKAKGKGFAGVVKRWGFKGGPRTHGQSDRLRAPGSIGAGTDPGRVLPGKKMPGRMGGRMKTVSNGEVIDVGDDYILIKGPLPGGKDSVLQIQVTSEPEKK